MTSEQIAELRKLHDGIIAQAGPWGGRESVSIPIENWRFLVACNNHLLRLLDEREALLKALKDAKAKLGDARSILSHCWAREEPPDKESVDDADAAEDAAEVAIAKAEAP